MSGFGNPFKEIPKEIFKSIKDRIKGKSVCHFCEREMKLKEMQKDYLDRWRCIDEKICLEVKKEKYK